jgi:hypothetical protein
MLMSEQSKEFFYGVIADETREAGHNADAIEGIPRCKHKGRKVKSHSHYDMQHRITCRDCGRILKVWDDALC